MTDSSFAPLLVLAHLCAVVCGIVAIQRMTQRGVPSPRVMAGLAVFCLMLALLTAAGDDPWYLFSDFRSAYHPAGRAIIEDPAALGALFDKGVSGFVNLPIVAYVFAPLGLLRLRIAIGVFTVVGLAVTLSAWWLLVRLARLDTTGRWLLLLLFAANGPLQYSLKEGNTSHFVLFALATGLALLRSGRGVAAGALLGVAAVFKLPLLLFGAYFVVRRHWRAAFGFAGVCLATAALSLLVFGWDVHRHWFETCVLQFSTQWIAAFNVQSVQSFVFRLQAPLALLRDWQSMTPSAGQRLAGYVAVGLLYAIALGAGIRAAAPGGSGADAELRQTREFLLVLCLALVSSPLSWSHYYAWLLLPVAFHLGKLPVFPTGRVARGIGWTAVLLATLLIRPLQFADPTVMLAYVVAGVSYLLLAGLLWFALIAWALVRTARTMPVAYRDSPATGYLDTGAASR